MDSKASGPALQDLMRTKTCFGCGAKNEHGLHLKSFWNGEECLGTFQPEPYMTAGPPQFVNGGVIATLVDCHAVSTAIAYWYDLEGREFGSAPEIWCVTASLHVDYKRPTPIGRPVELRAHVTAIEGRRATVQCSLRSGDTLCAIGNVVAVRVDQAWKEG